MNQSQCPVAKVSVSFRKCHLHSVGIKRKPKDTTLIQKPPNRSAAPLTAHKPSYVCLFIFTGDALSSRFLCFDPLFGVNIERIVFCHLWLSYMENIIAVNSNLFLGILTYVDAKTQS